MSKHPSDIWAITRTMYSAAGEAFVLYFRSDYAYQHWMHSEQNWAEDLMFVLKSQDGQKYLKFFFASPEDKQDWINHNLKIVSSVTDQDQPKEEYTHTVQQI